MTMIKLKKMALAILAISPLVASAQTLDLNNPYYYTYGNTNVYSLPILANYYDTVYGGGTGPGNPYYVNSTPGNIKDLVVIYTGASGTDVQTNTSGFDNAYLTPSGSPPAYASTFTNSSTLAPTNIDAPDPTGKSIVNNLTYSWDASIASLQTFLGAGGTPVFLFNNNETNKDQNLAIWAKLWITDGTSVVDLNTGAGTTNYLYLSNEGDIYGFGGTPTGDASLYNPGNIDPLAPTATGNTDYVLSGGTVCLAANLSVQACDGTEAYKINHNLGANQVAYAGVLPMLNSYLASLSGDLSQYTLHLELSLGCDPKTSFNTCDNFNIDNGYEQLFLASSKTVFVPEPGSLALLAIGLLALGGGHRVFKRRAKSSNLLLGQSA